MALLDDILKWTETKLPLWQRDAARRLFLQEDGLSSDDYAELYTLLKASHGLPNPLGLTPEPLKAAHLPTALKPGETVILKSMYDLKHVNCIASEEPLKFSTTGMTIIYGGNGSGKSGYIRVMKKACRARDQREQVHPNANDPTAQNSVPEAKFNIEINGTSKPVQWTSDSNSPDELATIAVFDSHCARAYLTAEQDVAYLPYGLDIVENLANKVLPELKNRLDEEVNGINIDRQPFNHLLGDTEVGKLISDLNDKTDPAKIKAVGTLLDKDLKRIAELDQAIAVHDPEAKAKELCLSAGRLKSLASRIESALSWVSNDAINKYRGISDRVLSATQAEKQAAEILQAGETLLPGTGEQVWKVLFDSARKFSTEVAYPGCAFPYIAKDAVCPLCQQPFNDEGKRLKRFEEYIQNDVAKAAEQQRKECESEKKRIEDTNVNIGLNESLTGELEQLDNDISSIASKFQNSLGLRRSLIVSALNSHIWDEVPVLSENPRQRIRDLAACQFKSARTFTKAADKNKKKALINEQEELRARQNLSACLNAVLALIDRLKKSQTLKSCEKNLKTKPISDKSKEFASSAVTGTLKRALDSEFKALGIGHIKTKLKERNYKGKIKHQLLLDLPTNKKLEEILSEGEQRAIALGSFLAELKMANHKGGIVFDDPVSSLDHWRRKNLATRLAKEATRRQVIVLTHDTSFLGQLRDEIDVKNISHSLQYLEWKGNNPGFICEGLPWGHKNYKERIDCLTKAQCKLEKKPWPAYPNEEECGEMRRVYSLLRATIERVIQDVAFNGVIRRYRDWVRVNGLIAVAGLEESDCKEIAGLYQRCNDVVDSHDPSSSKNDTVPTALELGIDIQDLQKIIKNIQDSRKE